MWNMRSRMLNKKILSDGLRYVQSQISDYKSEREAHFQLEGQGFASLLLTFHPHKYTNERDDKWELEENL